MNSSKRIQAAVVSCLIITMSLTSPAYARGRRDYSRTEEIVGGALIVGGIAAGLYAVGSWLFGQSDEEVVDKTRSAFYDANKRYGTLMTMFGCKATEHDLENWSAEIAKITPVDRILSEIKNTQDVLRAQSKELSRRAYKRNSDFMHALVHDVDSLMQSLNFVYDYLSLHMTYFKLDDAERRIFALYEQECTLLNTYANNPTEFNRQLRGVIARYGANTRSSYPYLDYVAGLKSNKATLDNLIVKAGSSYVELVTDALQLSKHIDVMICEITIDPEYMRSLKDRERDQREQLERERLMALERERIRLEQEMVYQRQQMIKQQQREYELRRMQELERLQRERERDRELFALTQQARYYSRPQAEVCFEFEYFE
jgi:hypothetical protein